MSGFIPDLASWALRGAAADNDDNNQDSEDPMSPEELRSQRLARLAMMQQMQQEDTQDHSPMDVDLAPENTIKPVPNPVPSPAAPAPEHKASQKTRKDSPLDATRKLQSRKEALLKKILNVVLEGTKTSLLSSGDTRMSSFVPSKATIVDTGSTEISVQTIAEILAIRLTMDSPQSSFNTYQEISLIAYLAKSHRLASEEISAQMKIQSSDQITQLLQEIQRQLVSYAATCLLEPELFPLAKEGTTQLAKCLLNGTGGSNSDPTQNNSITYGVSGSSSTSFYHLLIEELVEQNFTFLETSVVPAVVDYFIKLLGKCESVLDHGSSEGASPVVIVAALSALCSHKAVAKIIVKLPSFHLPPASSPLAKELTRPGSSLPANSSLSIFQILANPDSRPYLKRSGPALDKNTILGLCLRLGVPNSRTNAAVMNPAFSPNNILRQSLNAVAQETSQQRAQLKVLQTACYQFLMVLIKAGPDVREQVLQWFQDALLVNAGASALRPDATKVSSPNLLLNVSIVLLKLCDPFVDDESKQHLIDPGFVSSEKDHGGVFATSGDEAVVRLGGEENNSNPAMTREYKPKNSFIPVCFFFCARSLHLGLAPLLSQHENFLRHISHLHWQLSSSNRDLQSDPRFAMMIARQRSDEVALYQEDMVVSTLRFCNLCAKVLYEIDGDDVLRTMPEDFISDMCDIIISIAKLKASLLKNVKFQYVFKLIVKLLSTTYASMVRNYNLRAMLGDVLYEIFLPTFSGDRRDVPASVSTDPVGGNSYLLSDAAAQETLAPSLLLLYGEVEHTGYYDKMSHRAKISSVIKFLWESVEHRSAFRRITQNKDSFVKFANGIINETNTLIATVMQKLPEIKDAQTQMKNAQEWGNLAEDEQTQISSRLEDNEREVKHALPLCNKTLQMFGYLSTDPDIRSLFLLDELCSRLVTMLLHVLAKLVGSKGLELKVDNPDQYEFRPKEMLRDLCAIFALFASSVRFQDECAKAGSDASLLRAAVKTCRKLNLLTGDSMLAFESLPDVVEQATQLFAADEEMLKDAPDEFLDEILSTFMKDPVILPSGHYVDRPTISQHLLNDPTDPFNRLVMTIDDVKPATDLKMKMDKWLEEKRAARSRDDGL